MKRMQRSLLAVFVIGLLAVGMVGVARAAPIAPTFSDYPGFTSSQADLDATASAWFDDGYGLTFDHMYLYRDARDTSDGYGISNGWVSENSASDVTGTVFFAETTNYVELDWVRFGAAPAPTYSVYDGDNVLLDTFTASSGLFGSITLWGTGISYLTVNANGGFGGISGMRYDFDGNSGDQVVGIAATVPEPSILLLLGAALAAIGVTRRKAHA